MAVDIGRLKDLVPEILSRLPVKSLMRFKCVEKSWSHLIKDPNFISKHLHTLNQINMDDNGFCLLVNRNRSVLIGPPFVIGKVFVSLLSFDQATKTCSPNLLDLTYDFYNAIYLQMHGPFNGIYYLHSYPRLLINPSMRESKLVPETPSIPGALYFKSYNGFGFDPKTNDYKVVCITFYVIDFSAADMLRHAHVYALRCNCWREVNWPLPSCIHIRCQPLSDTFVQGASHWWAYDDDGDLVLAFDMLDEMFRAIRFPEIRSSIYFSGNVAKFKEFIAVIVCVEEGTEKQFDIWVMQDYGKEESWTKHLTIGPIAGVRKPLGFWKYHFVFEDNNGGMVLYDNQTQENENLGFHSATISLLAAVYMESLVSLRGDTDDSEETQTEVTFFDLVPDPLFDSNSG